MTKYYCDHCGEEIRRGGLIQVNLVDAYTVLKIDFEEGSRTYCELCERCRNNLRDELRGVLRKYSGEE